MKVESKAEETVLKIIDNMEECSGRTDKDDIIQEGLLTYFKVMKLPKLNKRNYSAYMNTSIKRSIQNYIKRNSMLVIPSYKKEPDHIDESSLEQSDIDYVLKKISLNLSKKEKDILSARYGEVAQTYQEIGSNYGVSKQRVQQIERRAILKLKKECIKNSINIIDYLGE